MFYVWLQISVRIFFQLLGYVCTFLSSNLRGKNPHKDQMGHELTCLLWRSSAVADRSEVN